VYLLDTNICIFIKNKKPIHVLERLQRAIDDPVYISSISVAELQFGVYNSLHIERNRLSLTEFLAPFEVLDFDTNDAEKFGILRSQLKCEGAMIGPYDMLIAAQALSKNLILVTNNRNEFKRIKHIKIEDWHARP